MNYCAENASAVYGHLQRIYNGKLGFIDKLEFKISITQCLDDTQATYLL